MLVERNETLVISGLFGEDYIKVDLQVVEKGAVDRTQQI
jgi:hypothetical protein